MRKMFSALLIFCASLTLYAQSSKLAGITDGDIQNWVKNFNTVQKEFIKLGLDSGLDYNQISSISADDRAALEQVLNKYGIYGTNSLERFAVITHCAIILASDSQMDEESKANMKSMGLDPIAELKSEVNPADYAVISANQNAIIQVINGN